MISVDSKLPHVGTTIFSVMSALAVQHSAVNLAQGFPNFHPDPLLQDLIMEHMRGGANQYAPMPGVAALRKRLSEKVGNIYRRSIDFEHEVTITAGGTQALFSIFGAFVRPGDEVILIEPCYDSYKPSIECMGGVVVPFALQAPHFQIDWQEVKLLLTAKTRMLCINTPGNPTGKALTADDMLELSQILKGTDVLLLSDEVYEHLIYDGRRHESVLWYDDLYQRSLSVFSFGKTFHATGWKIGYVLGPEYLMRELRKVHQFNMFSVHHPTQLALADYMADANTYLGLPSFYEAKRAYFLKQMTGSRFQPLACEGSYFQLFDYSAIAPDMDDLSFTRWLTEVHGVATIPVSVFYSDLKPNDRLVRICFAKTESVLDDAAARLVKVVTV
jgi:methionine transaminase